MNPAIARAVDGNFEPSRSAPSASLSLHGVTRISPRSTRPALSALQVLPYRAESHGDSLQFCGPDARTTGWVVVEHWSDGSSIEHDQFRTEEQAVEIAQELAADSEAFVEPYPWVIAVCLADGWEVAPIEGSASHVCDMWGFRRVGDRTYPIQSPQRNVFDAWRACLAYASAYVGS